MQAGCFAALFFLRVNKVQFQQAVGLSKAIYTKERKERKQSR